MKSHTIAAITAFGAGMFLVGYYAPRSQGAGWVPLGFDIAIFLIAFIRGLISYQ